MSTHVHTIWSLPVVKAALGVPDAETGRDTRIEEIADAVSAFIDKYTGRQFVTRGVSEVLDGDGCAELQLLHAPVVGGLTSLTITRAEGQAAETILSTAYTLVADRGRLRLLYGDVFTKGFGNVAVAYAAGYGAQDAVTIPRDISRVGLQMTRFEFQVDDVGAGASSTMTVQGHHYTPRSVWPAFVWDVLNQWRRRGLG
jgi:hypothetical protein